MAKDAALRVLEERVIALMDRFDKHTDALQALHVKADRIIALETVSTEMYNDLRVLLGEMKEFQKDLNGVGQRVTKVEVSVATHHNYFAWMASTIVIVAAAVVTTISWLVEKVYDGVLAVMHTGAPHP